MSTHRRILVPVDRQRRRRGHRAGLPQGRAHDREDPEGEVKILEPDDNVRVHRSGAVGSVQEAEILVDRDFLERIWNADSLELLARGYWAFLRRMSLGIIRMHYAHDSRTVTAFSLMPLLRFGTPSTRPRRGRAG